MSGEPTGREHLTPVRITDTSATERAGFRRCRRQWFLTTVHRLDRQEGNVNFFLGTLFHRALEEYYRAQQEGLDWALRVERGLDAYEALFADEMAKVKRQLGFLFSVGEPAFREAGQLGFEMAQNYFERERVAPLLDEVIAVEFRVRVPIRSPKGRRAGWLSVQTDIVGMKDGQLVVADHKTASREPNSAHLDLDDQLSAEVFSWWMHSGEFPVKAIYNVAMKRVPEPPKVLKNGRLSKDRGQTCTEQMYRDAIKERGLPLSEYLDFISYLRQREELGLEDVTFFRREETFRTPGQMEAFRRDLYNEFRDMREVARHPEKAYPSPSSIECPRCPVRAICVTIQDDGDVEAVVKAGYAVGDPRR